MKQLIFLFFIPILAMCSSTEITVDVPNMPDKPNVSDKQIEVEETTLASVIKHSLSNRNEIF